MFGIPFTGAAGYCLNKALASVGLSREEAYAIVQGHALHAADARVPFRDLVEAAQCLLGEDLAQPLSLESVARAVSSSPFNLCRLFKRGTGAYTGGLARAMSRKE